MRHWLAAVAVALAARPSGAQELVYPSSVTLTTSTFSLAYREPPRVQVLPMSAERAGAIAPADFDGRASLRSDGSLEPSRREEVVASGTPGQRLRSLPGLALKGGRVLARDTGYILSAPARLSKDDQGTAGFFAGLLAAGSFADEPVRDFTLSRQSGGVRRAGAFFSELGGSGAFPLLTAGVVWGLTDYVLSGETRLRDATLTAAESALVTSAVTALFKAVVGRSRPNALRGAYDFHPFGGGYSFPSGHSAAAFAAAAAVAQYYDQPWSTVAYTAAGLIAVSRISQDVHFLTDVAVGSAVGWFVGRTLGKRHLSRTPSRYQIAPLVTEGGGGAAVSVSF